MTADYRFTFVHTEGVSTVPVDVERHPTEWAPHDFDRIARLLVRVMKELGDTGPFRWCLIEATDRERVEEQPACTPAEWAFLVQGGTVHTFHTFLFRPEQLPRDAEEWRDIECT